MTERPHNQSRAHRGASGLARIARPRHPGRRGNAIILVAGILVLLVIIATAYVTRTQSARQTSVAVNHRQSQSNNAEVLAETFAAIPSEALFPAPVDPATPFLRGTADPNYPRLSLEWNPVRYGVDRDFDNNGFADYPYNFAPYQVVPWTNWPDALALGSQWPKGVGAPGGIDDLNEGNPLGHPGFGDTRWLRDFEPTRVDLYSSGLPGSDGRPDLFRMWRHMTNIAHPNNGFRIVTDISNVGVGTLVTDLSVPVEQWLVSIQPQFQHFDSLTGDARITFRENDFVGTLWYDWFYNYQAVYRDPNRIPPNFYHLKDLNGDGIFHQAGERPQDEFIRGSWRWIVNRVLTDTDGDGFTDSFWFLAPTPIERGVRQIVGVSIIDNSAMFNANVASSFWYGDLNFPERYGTAGETPADLAATGQQLDEDSPPVASWNVGFFDDHKNFEQYFDFPRSPNYGGAMPLYWRTSGSGNRPQVRWLGTDGWLAPRSVNSWYDRMYALGIFDNPAEIFPTAQQAGPLSRAEERRRYWLYGASQPFAARVGLTPFTTQDELELRMYHGQNYPWAFTRFEKTLNPSIFDDGDEYSFVRSSIGYDESTEYQDQLTNTELLYDHRRKLTLFNGARNDLLPPWLRWRWIDQGFREDLPLEVELDMLTDPQAEDRFHTQAAWKLDLREDIPNTFLNNPVPGTYYLHERLPWVMVHALADGDENGGDWLGGTYSGIDEVNEVRKAAASLTANILAWRDLDDLAPLRDDPATTEIEYGAVRLPEWGSEVAVDETQYLGMERQPFLMEAFVGHVYELFTIPGDPLVFGWTNSGDKVVFATADDGTPLESTVTALQIANPHDEPIVLYDPLQPDLPRYEVDFFGDVVSLYEVGRGLGLNQPLVVPPARHDRPATLIIYSIDGTFNPGNSANFQPKWLDFLDIEDADHPDDNDPTTPDTVIINLQDPRLNGFVTPWSTRRNSYDGLSPGANIELKRVDDFNAAPIESVVIDRIDGVDQLNDPNEKRFRDQVLRLGLGQQPPNYVDILNIPPQAPPGPTQEPHPTDGWDLTDGQTHWIQWARVTRAWGNDANGTIFEEPSERNPRYVYATNKVTDSDEVPFQGNGGRDLRTTRYWGLGTVGGVLFTLASDPDNVPGENLPWMTRDYFLAGGARSNRKPTFFDMAHELDPLAPNGWGYPDKGFYHSPYALQMLQKDDDFDQVGEVLNVWLYGHELEMADNGSGRFEYVETERTFSEAMARHQEDHPSDEHVNRLVDHEAPLGIGLASDPFDARHAYPALPATARVLDAFVCDGPGQLRDYDGDGTIGDQDDLDIHVDRRFANALGFSGRITPGLVNINTAPVEVMRTLPHWNKLVHADPTLVLPAYYPRSALPEAVVSYRERYENYDSGGGGGFGLLDGPDYKDRPVDQRADRGIASIGELRNLDKDGRDDTPSPFGANDPANVFGLVKGAWKADFAADAPFTQIINDPAATAAFMSTDVNRTNLVEPKLGDGVAGDSEEINLLLAGASNLISTRSDMFTVYFRVRSFRQNPTTQIWDATDPEYIVDDSRYVMLVDRSEVNRPSDKPRILFLEKLPN